MTVEKLRRCIEAMCLMRRGEEDDGSQRGAWMRSSSAPDVDVAGWPDDDEAMVRSIVVAYLLILMRL